MEIIQVDVQELEERIEKNYQRLLEPYYQIQDVFSDSLYEWAGDKEGRALLAFVSHYQMSGKKIPCMDLLVKAIPEKANSFFYLGREANAVIDEQQLSGHNWYLRGLLEYYEQFHDEKALCYVKSTIENLYFPTIGRFSSYPVERKASEGGVSGNLAGVQEGWNLSTDVGCAFMSIDGLSHYYQVTKDERVLVLLDEMQEMFDSIDKMQIKAQTHCCLTAARGFIRLYQTTGIQRYFDSAMKVIDLYIEKGMTYTYQNFNFWNYGDCWTEPCAIVDSLMAFTEVYKITKEEKYRNLAARIWHNAFRILQAGNGGAGTTTTISDTQHILQTDCYEAFFCCTMRLAEGLRYVSDNKELLYAITDSIGKDEHGRYMCGDIIYTEIVHCEEAYRDMIDTSEQILCDGHVLQPLVQYYRLPREMTETLKQRVIFSS